ncbi:uncharacterized protein BDFB_003588 [Asbolus verrucosus]|uniref:DUF4802 domain-containing protein n=1 Tax=Asbolus verrucosus TaxID=1661398 RepID=A0A482VU06_ASBVE|nr:uncharacterized protein BDFB_003588 [Asbolus verrucosus]
MSKSNSSTRSNSMETPAECESEVCSPQSNVPAILEAAEGQEVVPSSPPPSYEYVLEEGCEGQNSFLQTRLKAQADASSPVNSLKGPEIMHKSSKELYRAVAKQFGITCKMSDQCRCFDCQSHYFDCEYEQNEQEKTDGGLGAGTPMFISEVMHGTACIIL